MMFHPIPHRSLASIIALTTLGVMLLFAAHRAAPHQRCPFVPRQCQPQTASMIERHVAALRSFSTATFDGRAALATIMFALVSFAFAPLVVPRMLGPRPALSREGASERFLAWFVLLEQRDPLVRRAA